MADNTRIEWTDATWNPVTGCSKVSAGCKHCYARRDWARLAANPKTRYFGRVFENVQCHHDVLDLPLRWRRPRRIFVNSMSDLFHEDVPDQFIADVFAYMAFARHHSFQVLTKRPERMAKLLADRSWIDEAFADSLAIAGDDACDILGRRCEFDANRRNRDDIRAFDPSLPLANVWLGVSVEDQATADERIPLLLKTPAALRWISAEPLLGPVRFHWGRWLPVSGFEQIEQEQLRAIDWVVAGGESGPKARPMHPDWARSLREQCAVAGIPFLFKQWGEWVPADQCDNTTGDALYTDGGKDLAHRHLAVGIDGYAHADAMQAGAEPQAVLYRAGKKAAGRQLDGVEHNGYPETPK